MTRAAKPRKTQDTRTAQKPGKTRNSTKGPASSPGSAQPTRAELAELGSVKAGTPPAPTEGQPRRRKAKAAATPAARAELDHRAHLREALKMARKAQKAGSSPVGAVIVDARGRVLARGRNRVGEAQSKRHVGDCSLAHAEMDLYFQLGKLKHPETLTLYSSLEPCLMCGGATALLAVGRVVWATDDPWGGAGRLIKWADHPAMQSTQVLACPDPELEAEGARLFAPEARRAFPPEGWAVWRERYPAETEGVDKPGKARRKAKQEADQPAKAAPKAARKAGKTTEAASARRS